MSLHTILITVPQPLRGRILSPGAWDLLQSLGTVILNEDGHNWNAQELAARLPGVEALITGWGIVRLTEEVLAGADRLRIIAHSAGTVKGFVTEAVYARGIVVTHAASRIADSVAELSLLLALMGLRRPQDFDRQMKSGVAWPASAEVPTYEIAGMQVGLLGMGYVGRKTARLFQGVGAEVWAYDPYLAPERAAELGVHKAELDDLLRTCPVISVHLPVTDETHHLLGKRELALVREGAVFVNTARSWVVDQQALLEELSTGRFWAALDVFDTEPLPAEHPFRRLPNVLLTPHIAGLTRNSYQSLIETVAEEVTRFFNGEALKYPVTQAMLATMA